MRADRLAVAVSAALLLASCHRSECSVSPPPVPADLGPLQPLSGYLATIVLTGLNGPTQFQFDTTGRLFVLEGMPNTFKRVRVFGSDLEPAGEIPINTPAESTGLLVVGAGDEVFVASRGRIDRFVAAGSGWSAPEPWVTGLPSGNHTNNGIALGPDGNVYFTVGSTCDLCDEPDPRSATIMRAPASASAPTPEVFARGLRNSYDLTFTSTGDFLATDNGPECCDDTAVGCSGAGPDRLLQVTSGADFGWPSLYRNGGGAVPGELTALPFHGGATGLVVYEGNLLCADRGSAFVTLWGTQHGATETGRRVYRARLTRDPSGALAVSALDPFLGPSGLANPIDVTVGPDGALYVLDSTAGTVVRVALAEAAPCP